MRLWDGKARDEDFGAGFVKLAADFETCKASPEADALSRRGSRDHITEIVQQRLRENQRKNASDVMLEEMDNMGGCCSIL